MKNYNLIEWLWKTDSHEKQKPQGFGRYAVMLLMLLTLGVGQMWATDLYVRGYNGTWDANSTTKMSGTSSPWTFTAKYWSNASGFKIADNSWGSINCGSASITFGSKVSMTNSGSSSNMSFSIPDGGGIYTITVTLESGTYKIKVDKVVEEGNDWVDITDPTVYFDNSAASYSNVSIVIGRAYGYGGQSQGYLAKTLSSISNTSLYYTQSIDNASGDASKYTTMLFANASMSGWTGSKQATEGVVGKTSYTGTSNNTLNSNTYLYKAASGTKGATLTKTDLTSYTDLNKTQTIQVRISENNGSTYSNAANFAAWPGTINVTRTYLSSATTSTSPAATAMTATTTTGALTSSITFTGASTTEYTFAGWSNSNSSPDGNTSKTYTITDASTKYAFYKRKQYTLSYGVNSSTRWGSITLNSGSAVTTTSSSTLNHGTSISFTASANSGYQVEGWYSDASCTVGNRLQSGGNSYDAGTLTAAKTVYVKFEEKTGGIITLSAGANGQVSADNSSWGSTKYISDITTATDVNIYAKGNTGYQFSSWTKSSGSGTIKTNAASGVFTTVAYGDATVTASFSEIMRTINISGGTVYGGAATSTTAGVATSAKITANAPAAGKKFTGWTLGSGVSLKGGYSLTDRTIEIYSTANATVTATYANRAGVKMYFAKPPVWGASTLYAYAWQNGGSAKNANYPGVTLSTTETINCVTYYTYQYYTEGDGIGGAATGNSAWNRIIFGCNDDAKKTGDLTISNGHYYYWNSSTTGAASAVSDVWYIKGTMNTWGTTDPVVLDCANNKGSVNINLTAGTTYEFKVYDVINTKMWSNSTACGQGDGITSSMATAQTLYNNDDNVMKITPNVTGPYTFEVSNINTTSPKIKVTFPTSYTVTFNAETFVNDDASHSTSTTGGTLSAVDGNDAALSSGGTVITGGSAIITASKNTGYSFIGFYTNAACTTAVSGAGVSISDNVLTLSSISANKTVYAKFSENMTTVNLVASPTGKGTFTKGGAAVTSVKAGVTTKPAVTAVAGTGYRVNTSATVWAKNNSNITLSSTTTNPVTVTGCGTASTSSNLTATFTPITYTIRFNGRGNTSGSMSNQTGVTYDASTTITANAFVKTGYTFAGWATTPERAAAGTVDRTDGAAHGNLSSTQGATVDLYAVWTPKQSALTLDKQTSATGYGSAGTVSTSPGSATYDAAMPTLSGTMPTAANGYAFMGFYSATGGGGTKYYNADGTSANNWAEDTESGTTLYAYYKKAEITALTLDAAIVETNATVGVTPTVSPTPTGNTKLCFYVFHSNDNPLSPQPEISWNGTKATFDAGAVSGTYKVGVSLRTGTACGGGTLLDSTIIEYQVAGSHTVTVNYKCGDDVIKAATSLEGIRPLDWSDDITAPDIFGYTFSSWSSADGVTIKDSENEDVTSSTEATIKIKATYAGSLTANYTQNQMIFFKNTLGWSDVYVNFYTGSYWNNPKGSGNQGVTNKNKHMTQLGETDIWYYDYGAASISPSLYVSFTSASQDGSEFFWKSGGVNVVYPANYQDDIHTNKSSETGFKASTPMFVPLATQDKVTLNDNSGGKANYYNDGYWTTFTPGTGYVLEIYNSAGDSKLKSVDFTSADDLMPMKATVDLEGGQTYKFQIRRGGESSAGVYYGNSGTMTYTNHGQDTPWSMTNSSFSMAGITSNAAGDYTFNLSYSPNASNEYRLRIAVDYPVKSGDYRLVYSDAVQTKPLTSAIVNKVDNGTDIVSFFVRSGSTPVLRMQQATVDGKTGAITWKEYPTDGTPTNQITGTVASAISSGGTEVYNFNLSMNGSGALSVASAEIYEGNFYIRTDAANSKWDNYRTDPDHRMTYSEYSITHGGYTHYYTHWIDKDETGRKNVKFVIANDYSPNISDTLARETASGTWTNISDFMEAGGDLKRSANVRFMWDKRSNAISRAYIDGAQTEGTQFLTLLSSDDLVLNPSTSAVQATTTFSDKGNWMYEANVKAKPGAEIKLKSSWGKSGETDHIIDQYFKGSSTTTEQLIGGSGSTAYDIRIIYDFKTNRMIAGLIPSGNIENPMAINADVMFVREHHGDIAQLTFTDDGAITDIKTAFGVLQFNKWTINNKSTEGGHSPLSPLLSRYERDLFYISFPFKVAMEDVFGFGTYGQHWIIEEYDGATRAANGYWLESAPNWKFIFNRKDRFFEPGQGYIIALDLDEMGESADIWANTDRVELYFPSYGTMDDITKSTAKYNIPAHECTINRTVDASGNPTGLPADYDRRVKDSHWNVLGVPTYVNPDAPNFANTAWTTTATETSIGPNFLYEWNKTDNSVTAVSAKDYEYHAMHAYLVQYCGDVTWTSSVSVEPSSIVARRTSAERPQSVEFRLQMQQNDVTVDQTFVKLSDDEAVTTGFEFNYDLSKEFNKNRSNIYTFIGTEQVAGNVLPMSEQTTVVPVGVIAKTTGDYTFAIPEGTEGIGVTLIDNETGIRTSLSALTYTINLEAGTYNERFVLEISPISQVLTDIDNVQSDDVQGTKAHKVMIDGLLYIVKDGVMYDARGARVE